MNDAALAEALSALAGETRLRILRLLQQGAVRCRKSRCDLSRHCCNVSELAEALGVSVPTASHHLRELRRAGLVRMQRRGRFVEASLDAEALARLAAVVDGFAAHGPRQREATDA